MQELETMEKSDMKEQEEEYKIPPFGLINYEPIPEEVRAWREEEVDFYINLTQRYVHSFKEKIAKL